MEQRTAIGIDMGGTKTLAVVYSESEGILASQEIATDRYAPPDITLPQIVQLVERITYRAGLSDQIRIGVGIGVAGLVSPDRIFIDSIILPAWHSVDVGSWLSERLKTKVIVDNDATMAAIGHLAGRQGACPDSLICLTLGTGVGAAVIVNGAPMRGPDGTAGQLGHMTVDLHGRACSCGSRGCLNAYVSGTAIAERYTEHISSSQTSASISMASITGRAVSEAAQKGDPVAREVIMQTSLYLGAGLANIVNIFNPDVIAICGGVADLGESLLVPARATISERAFRQPAQNVQVERGCFGAATGAVGAAICTWEQS